MRIRAWRDDGAKGVLIPIVKEKGGEMKVSEMVEKFGLKVYAGGDGMYREVSGGYVSDLLSDVMGNAAAGEVWITLQTHQNVAAIASLKELAAVIFVKSLEPDEDTIIRSREEGVPLLGTDRTTFEMAGKLYEVMQ